MVRTTIDIDAELHADAQAEALRLRTTMSALVNEAIRRALRPVPPIEEDPITGLGVVTLGRPVTADDVAVALEE
jgi:hypothetical protein